MITLIEPGNEKIVYCPECECKFKYEREDISYRWDVPSARVTFDPETGRKTVKTEINPDPRPYITCPWCGKAFILKGWRIPTK